MIDLNLTAPLEAALHAHATSVSSLGNCSVKLTWNMDGKLSGIHCFEGVPSARPSLVPEPITRLVRALHSYFENGVPLGRIYWDELDTTGLSEFQLQVYDAITKIPHGETRTYGWVAGRLRNPAAGRTVGQALKKNPFPILVPCHRVVATASLGGFMGRLDPQDRELELKRQLLRIEEEYLNPVFPFLLGNAFHGLQAIGV